MMLEPIIGLEFHIQLKTKSKMFCACSNEPNLEKPNENICPICLGHPGILPTVNQEAINMGIKMALALNCQINQETKFDRKNYFYPDLPKGYQISQYDQPLAQHGHLTINFMAPDGLAGSLSDDKQLKRIGITRLHMEEDSAKSTHQKDATLIDFNRGGSPLIEIVSEADLRSPQEAKTFGQELQLLARHLGISDADMEKGQLRCDANISLRRKGEDKLYTKTEIKNINSFNTLEKALSYEIERQTLLWKANLIPDQQETRGWNDATGETVVQRVKETQMDYRYFKEPDLPPLTISDKQIEEIKGFLPELPQSKRLRFVSMYEFTGEEAKILTENKKVSQYSEQVISELKDWLATNLNDQGTAQEIWEKNKKKAIKLVASWLINKLLPLLAAKKIAWESNPVTAENFAEFITLIYQNKVNSTASQAILEEMVASGADPEHVMEQKDLRQMDSSADLGAVIDKIITAYPAQAKEYRSGKEPLIKFFLGILMKETKGKANPQIAQDLLKKHLLK